MAEITASSVKELREKTGAGMMDCKKALTESNGDMEGAVDWLRKKGLAAAAKKSGRVAAQGLVGVSVKDNQGVIIEVNSETDFVARNDKFQQLCNSILEISYGAEGDIEKLKSSPFSATSRTVEAETTEHIAIIGENLNLRRYGKLKVTQGVVVSYVHNQVVPGLGKIGVLVALESNGDKSRLNNLGKQLAMHIAAAKPESLNAEELNPELIAREKQIFSEQARNSGKPESIIEKMVDGRLRKFYEEVVLLEQIFVIDGKTKINEVVEQAAKEMGSPVKIASFIRFSLGEGIEQEVKNFADEVAAAAGIS